MGSVCDHRKQIVEDLRALKGDAEDSLEQRLEAAETALAERLSSIEASVVKAQEIHAVARSPSDQELIGSLTREKLAMATQLKDAFAKIDEQQRTIQEERATFWEELDLMRSDKEPALAQIGSVRLNAPAVLYTQTATEGGARLGSCGILASPGQAAGLARAGGTRS